MDGTVAAHANVLPQEIEAARLYRMEIEWPAEDEIFIVRFPDAPGVMTHGATREEAAAQGEDAITT